MKEIYYVYVKSDRTTARVAKRASNGLYYGYVEEKRNG